MAITGVGNYSSVYENTYASSRKEAAKKEETKETAATEKNAEVAKSGGNEEYLNNLQKQFPNMKLQVGYGVNTKNDGKVDVLNINPKLLEKMQNDPKAAKEYTQRLNKSFPIFRTIDFCKKAPLLSHLQIPAYTLTELFCKNYTTLQIKSGIAPSVACQIVLKSIVYIVLFCYNWTIYFTQFS